MPEGIAWGGARSTPNPRQQASGEGIGQELLWHQEWQKLAHVFNPESLWGGEMAQLLKVLVM